MKTLGRWASGRELMALDSCCVRDILLFLISFLSSGVHLVAMGSPARLTTAVVPEMAEPQLEGAWKSTPGSGIFVFAEATFLVKTWTV